MIERLKRFADTGNAVRFLLSFVLAFALWAWVTNEQDPEQQYRASQVPVTAENVPDTLRLVGSLPAVDVTLYGPQSVIQTIDAGSITATIDLSDADGPGTYEAEVEIDAPDGIRKEVSDPDQVTAELDTVVSRSFDVATQPPGDTPRNLRITSVAVNPPAVTVTGVQRNVNRVVSVVAQIDLEGRTNTFSTDVLVVALDADNVPVEDVEVTPASVTLDVDLELSGKEIPVFVNCDCDAAEGFQVIGQPQPEPERVIVDGPADVLATVQYIYTTPVDASGLESPEVFSAVPLDTQSLPDGVTVEPLIVDVSVRVEQRIVPQTFEEVPIQVLNPPPGMRVVVNPPSVSVVLQGPREVIANLQQDDIAVVLDASGLDVGAHQVQPQLILPPNVSYSEPLPEVVVSIVEVQPTPTTDSTAEPAPTATAVS
jgi:YbbR domain-containing protein